MVVLLRMSKTVHHYTTALLTLALVTTAVVVFASVVKVQATNAQPESGPAAADFKPIAPNLNLPQPARSYTDLPYCQTNNPQQSLDIFAPAYQPNQPAPVLIFVHGGGWNSSDKRTAFIDYYKPYLLQQGIAVASLNHRLAPGYTFPAQNQDVVCAIDFIYQNANLYGLDSGRLALFGESSGAQLITAVTLQANPNRHRWLASVKAVIPFYGISDFQSLLKDKNYHGNARMYLGRNPQAQALPASVIYQSLKLPPPFLIVHGDQDPVVPVNQSIALYRHLQKYNSHNQLMIIKGAGHGITMKSKPNSAQLRTIVINYLKQQFSTALLK